MNWGMLPFQMKNEPAFEIGDYILVPNVLDAMDGDMQSIKAYVLGDEVRRSSYIAPMTEDEKEDHQSRLPHQFQPQELK